MPKSKNETPTKLIARVNRLRRRANNIMRSPNTPGKTSELSALEWAIPVLEQHIKDKFGFLPPSRYPMYKHEKQYMLDKLILKYGRICYYCKKKMVDNDITIDHWIPLSKGGVDGFYNYRLLHNACNLEKGNRVPEYD